MKAEYIPEHVIQIEILRKLLNADQLRFSQLKPAGTESNLFMYHLKQLIRHDMIEKTASAYQLGKAGKTFLDRSSLETLTLRKQPKIITILAVQNADKQWLVLERLHQPFLHYRGFPSGKLHYGESLQEAAQRELKEKAGISNVALTLRGNVAMRFLHKDDRSLVANHIIGYVFTGMVQGDAPGLTEKNYRTFWASSIDEPGKKNIKGHNEIIELLEGKEQFIESLEFISDY